MNQRHKRIRNYFIFFSLIIILGVVYAILQANLQINGTAKIKENTWDIHFDNIEVNEDSVAIGTEDIPASIDPENNCKVDFEVTLSLPGDFYEFTVDVVNSGTIDGMIGTLEKTLIINNEIVSEVPDYLNYTVTYEDDTEILENHLLAINTTETFKIRLEFKTDIEELPETTTIFTSLEPVFIQADLGAVPVREGYTLTPGLHFVNFNYYAYLGQELSDNITTYDSIEDTLDLWDVNYVDDFPEFCAKVVVDNNNIVTEMYNVFSITEREYNVCNDFTIGTYELRAGIDETSLPEEQQVIFHRNIDTLNLAFGEAQCEIGNNGYDYPIYQCNHNDSPLYVSVSLNGEMVTGMNGDWPHCFSTAAYESDPAFVGCYP
ncbi:MAG: hypothetical protein IJG68_03955 [Bacilli bacterium]|nr:hypothetical protein [Bacilli bacterium]